MTPQEQEPANGEEAAAENQQPETAEPTLNRAQRRAQAKGKKGAPDATHPGLPFGGNLRGPNAHGSGFAGKTKLPRTGHK